MLGDTAVAVHPENEKLKHLIGKMAILRCRRRIRSSATTMPIGEAPAGEDHPGARLHDFEVAGGMTCRK